MSAKLNIVLFSKDVINIEKIIEFLKVMGLSISIQKVETIKNWDYDNLQERSFRVNTASIKNIIESGDILLLKGLVNSIYNFGLIINRVDDKVYELRCSIDTNLLKYLDKDILDSSNKSFYESISEVLLVEGIFSELLFASIGVESEIKFEKQFEDILTKSHNILRWIVPSRDMADFLGSSGFVETSPSIWDKNH